MFFPLISGIRLCIDKFVSQRNIIVNDSFFLNVSGFHTEAENPDEIVKDTSHGVNSGTPPWNGGLYTNARTMGVGGVDPVIQDDGANRKNKQTPNIKLGAAMRTAVNGYD